MRDWVIAATVYVLICLIGSSVVIRTSPDKGLGRQLRRTPGLILALPLVVCCLVLEVCVAAGCDLLILSFEVLAGHKLKRRRRYGYSYDYGRPSGTGRGATRTRTDAEDGEKLVALRETA